MIYTALLEMNGIYSQWTKDAVPISKEPWSSQTTALEIDSSILRRAESVAKEVETYYVENDGTNPNGYLNWNGMGIIQECLEEEFEGFVYDYLTRKKDEIDESIAEGI